MKTKIIRTYSIDTELYKKFKAIIDEKGINSSKFISNKIREYIQLVEETEKELNKNEN